MDENARRALDVQNGQIKEGKRRHEADVGKLKDELKEDAARGIFSMKLTEKQQRNLPVSMSFPTQLEGKRVTLYSACCGDIAREVSASFYRGHVTRRYVCRGCSRDCELKE